MPRVKLGMPALEIIYGLAAYNEVRNYKPRRGIVGLTGDSISFG
jgi:hypothetical protein